MPNLEVRVGWYDKDTWLAQYEEVDLGRESFDDIVKAWDSSELEMPTQNTAGIVLDAPFDGHTS